MLLPQLQHAQRHRDEHAVSLHRSSVGWWVGSVVGWLVGCNSGWPHSPRLLRRRGSTRWQRCGPTQWCTHSCTTLRPARAPNDAPESCACVQVCGQHTRTTAVTTPVAPHHKPVLVLARLHAPALARPRLFLGHWRIICIVPSCSERAWGCAALPFRGTLLPGLRRPARRMEPWCATRRGAGPRSSRTRWRAAAPAPAAPASQRERAATAAAPPHPWPGTARYTRSAHQGVQREPTWPTDKSAEPLRLMSSALRASSSRTCSMSA